MMKMPSNILILIIQSLKTVSSCSESVLNSVSSLSVIVFGKVRPLSGLYQQERLIMMKKMNNGGLENNERPL
jgi:hypothetical protein